MMLDIMQKKKFFGSYSQSSRTVFCSVLLMAYVASIIMLYRYDVVENGLYFSFGFEPNHLPFVATITWFLGLVSILLIGNFSVIDSAYKLFCVCFVLMVALPAILFSDMIEGEVYWIVIVDFSLVTILLAIFSRISFSGIEFIYRLPVGLYFIPILSCLAFVIYMLIFYRGEIVMVDLDSVYGLRESAKDYQSSMFKYAQGFILGAAAPFCLVFGLYKRNFLLVILAVSSYFLVYMSSGHKSAIMTIFVVIFVYFFAKKLSVGLILTMAVLGMSLILILDSFVFGGKLASFTFDRMIGAPAVLSILYYDYFQDAPKFLLSHSIFSGFSDNIYSISPQQLIGSVYFSDDWANVNFVGEGFANFGRIGVYIYFFVVVFLVRFYDYVSRGLPVNVRLSIFVPVLLFLLNASPLTLILTGGYVGLVIVLFFRKSELNFSFKN